MTTSQLTHPGEIVDDATRRQFLTARNRRLLTCCARTGGAAGPAGVRDPARRTRATG